MTDKEIEKALKHCEDTGDYELCKTCPYANSPLCTLHDDALNYIKRLKAEKEQAKKDTAKEILQYLYERIGNTALSDSELVKNLALQYGVEVD